jgi:DNA primase
MIDLSSVDVVDMLERLELRNVRLTSGGREANFSCFKPDHAHADERPSAYMNVETTAWWCFGCKSRGNAIGFVAEVQQVSRVDAQRWLRDTYGIEFQEPQGGSMVGEIEARLAPPVAPPRSTRPTSGHVAMLSTDWRDAGRYEHQHHYLLDRGFIPDTLEEFEVGYDYFAERLTFPVYDLDGTLVGIKGRVWRDGHEPKYLVMGDRGDGTRYGYSPYEATEVVYGLNRRRDLDVVVLCEGELNAWACYQAGVESVARPCALGMSYLSERHAQLLAREASDVFLLFDPDDAGREGVWGRRSADGRWLPGAAELLERYLTVWVVEGHDADPAELVKQGRGEEVIGLLERAQTSTSIRVARATLSR